MKRKIDKRTIATKAKLKKITLDILLHSNVKLNITNLTNMAQINRNTFYLHYQSIKEIIIDIYEDIASDIISEIDKNKIFQYITSPLLLMETISNYLLKEEDYLEFLFDSAFSNEALDVLILSVSNYLTDEYRSLLESTHDIYYYSINFLVNGYINSLKSWYLSSNRIELDLIQKQISKLSLYGVKETYLIELNKNNNDKY